MVAKSGLPRNRAKTRKFWTVELNKIVSFRGAYSETFPARWDHNLLDTECAGCQEGKCPLPILAIYQSLNSPL